MMNRDTETRRREVLRNIRAGTTSDRDAAAVDEFRVYDYQRGIDDGAAAVRMESISATDAILCAVGAFLAGAAFSALVVFPW